MRLCLATIVVIASTAPGIAGACTCFVTSGKLSEQVNEAVSNSELVAEVEILTVKTVTHRRLWEGEVWSWEDRKSHPKKELRDEPKLVATFRTIRIWKGAELNASEVETNPEWQACGLGFKPGIRVLLYAYTTKDGSLETDSCSRTALIESSAGDIRILDKRSRLSPPN